MRYRIFARPTEDSTWIEVYNDRDPINAAWAFILATSNGEGDLDPGTIADDLRTGNAFERTDSKGVLGLLVRDDSPLAPETYEVLR